jgi:hypothetical protein
MVRPPRNMHCQSPFSLGAPASTLYEKTDRLASPEKVEAVLSRMPAPVSPEGAASESRVRVGPSRGTGILARAVDGRMATCALSQPLLVAAGHWHVLACRVRAASNYGAPPLWARRSEGWWFNGRQRRGPCADTRQRVAREVAGHGPSRATTPSPSAVTTPDAHNNAKHRDSLSVIAIEVI